MCRMVLLTEDKPVFTCLWRLFLRFIGNKWDRISQFAELKDLIWVVIEVSKYFVIEAKPKFIWFFEYVLISVMINEAFPYNYKYSIFAKI